MNWLASGHIVHVIRKVGGLLDGKIDTVGDIC